MSIQPDNTPDQTSGQRYVHPLERPVTSQPSEATEPSPQTRQVVVDMPYSKPVLTILLIAVNVMVFLADFRLQALGMGAYGTGPLTILGAKNNVEIINGELWRVITPLFLHGGIIHLGFNNYFLYQVGRSVERTYRTARFAVLYFLSGVTGAVFSFIFSPYNSIGASGALFGIIGAMIPLLYLNQSVFPNARRQMRSVFSVIAINLLIGLSPGIDNWGHLGGLVGGLILGWVISPRFTTPFVDGQGIHVKDTSKPAVSLFAAGVYLIGISLVLFLAITLKN